MKFAIFLGAMPAIITQKSDFFITCKTFTTATINLFLNLFWLFSLNVVLFYFLLSFLLSDI